jgi:hypothetical protein
MNASYRHPFDTPYPPDHWGVWQVVLRLLIAVGILLAAATLAGGARAPGALSSVGPSGSWTATTR